MFELLAGGWGILLLILVLALCGAAFVGGMRLQQRRRVEGLDDHIEPLAGRLAVLESTPVDGDRRLVLVRCDDVEHLMMVGGPADVVVDSDVRKGRGAGQAGRTSAKPLTPVAVAPVAPHAPMPRMDAAAPGRPEAPGNSLASIDPATGQNAAAEAGAGSVADLATAEAAKGPARPAKDVSPGVSAGKPSGTAGDQQPTPTPAQPLRPGPRRGFFQAGNGANRNNPGAAQKPPAAPGSTAAEPKGGTDKAAGQPGAASREGQGRSAAPNRPALTAVPGNAGDGQRQKDQPAVANRSIAPAPSGAGRNVDAPPAQRVPNAQGQSERRPPQAPQRIEPQMERSPPPVTVLSPAAGAAEAPTRQAPAEVPAAGAGNAARPGATQGSEKAASLPVAGTPWEAEAGIEDEIERALRSDPQSPLSRSPNPGAPDSSGASQPRTDSAATLGDLADRLESALAREMVGAERQTSKPAAKQTEPFDLNLDEFAFDVEAEQSPPRPGAPDTSKRSDEKPPQPEPRARQEEAPVISLNARRREAVDPLEDEMARLLGELTGDINRR